MRAFRNLLVFLGLYYETICSAHISDPSSTNSYGYSLSNDRTSGLDQLISHNDPESPTGSWNLSTNSRHFNTI
jgi:hypothetical protein